MKYKYREGADPPLIEKGIPVPRDKRGKHFLPAYRWEEMEIGDSFFVPRAKAKSMNGTLDHWQKKLNRRFISRPWTDEKLGVGVRVWRMEKKAPPR